MLSEEIHLLLAYYIFQVRFDALKPPASLVCNLIAWNLSLFYNNDYTFRQKFCHVLILFKICQRVRGVMSAVMLSLLIVRLVKINWPSEQMKACSAIIPGSEHVSFDQFLNYWQLRQGNRLLNIVQVNTSPKSYLLF